MIKNIKLLLLVSLTFLACTKKEDDVVLINSADGLPLTAGSANFSKYVALGNSLSAGYSDGALFKEAQKTSWTAILADQFKLVGGGEFKIPFMADNVGSFTILGNIPQGVNPRLYFNGVGPVPVGGVPTTEILNPAVSAAGPYNNCGVPGAKSFHLLSSGYGTASNLSLGSANPFYVRFASQTSPKSVIDYAMDQSPTFFSLWIGNNDVLGYATSGGDDSNPITPATGAPGTGFDGTYTALITKLTANGAKGVVSNIPYVTSVPFFTTVPIDPIPGLAPANATQLNQLFGGINTALTEAGLPKRFATIVADDGNPKTIEKNPLLIKDESLPNISVQITVALTPTFGAATAGFIGGLYGQARHAVGTGDLKDYILLTARGVIGTTQAGPIPPSFSTIGVTYPMEDKTTLTANEVSLIKTATDAYNATIKSLANSKGLAFVDANLALAQVANGGITSNGYTVKSDYVTGGGFSLDGVHPSPRGYALLANEFIKAINSTYGSNLKGVNLGDYRIQFPKNL